MADFSVNGLRNNAKNSFNLIDGTDLGESLNGSEANDLISARGGDDVVDAGEGSDVVALGSGDDVVVHSLAGDGSFDLYLGGDGTDTLELQLTEQQAADADLVSEIDALIAWSESGAGGSFSSPLLGFKMSGLEKVVIFVDGAQVYPEPDGPVVIDLSGSNSNETVEPPSDADHLITTGNGDDTITTGAGNDVLHAGSGNDTLYPSGGNDVAYGGEGDDLFIGGSGAGDDIYDGGPGTDSVTYASATTSVTVDLRATDRSSQQFTTLNGNPSTIGDLLATATDPDTGVAYAPNLAVGYATGAEIGTDILINIENATGGSGDDLIHGNDDSNRLEGLGGDDEINGWGGIDQLEGGAGQDTLDGGDGDDLLIGGADNDTVYGGAGYDVMRLSGNKADYVITSLGGGLYEIADTGATGDGVDVFAGIEVFEFLGDGGVIYDYELPSASNVIGTSGNDMLYGTEGNDVIAPLEGNDVVYGYGGGDYIIGAAGNDTIYAGDGYDHLDYGNLAGGLYVDLSAQVVQFTEGGILWTQEVHDVEMLTATAGDDTLIASDEGTRFYARGGNDTIIGGAGFDTLAYDNPNTPGSTLFGVQVAFSLDPLAAGSGTVYVDPFGGTDTFEGIENITLSILSDIALGGAGDQVITDGEGSADLVDGGDGFDQLLIGGPGGIYIDLDNTVSFATVAELSAFLGFTDALAPEIETRLAADLADFVVYTDGYGATNNLARNFERIGGSDSDDTMIGDNENNWFEGFGGNDILTGGGGNDDLVGGLGDDELYGGSGEDVLVGDFDNDRLVGGTGDDLIYGGFGSDTIVFAAGDGNDVVADFELGVDHLELTGASITLLSELDVDGDGTLDTRVTLDTGETIDLLLVTGVLDPLDLL